MSETEEQGLPRIEEGGMDMIDRSFEDSATERSSNDPEVSKSISSLPSLSCFVPESCSSPVTERINKIKPEEVTDNDPDINVLPTTIALHPGINSQESLKRKRGRPRKSIISGNLIAQNENKTDSCSTSGISANELHTVPIDNRLAELVTDVPNETFFGSEPDSPKMNFLASLDIISPDVLDKIQQNDQSKRKLKQRLRSKSHDSDAQSSHCFVISDSGAENLSMNESGSSQSSVTVPRKRGRPRKEYGKIKGFGQGIEVSKSYDNSTPRKRGRPRKEIDIVHQTKVGCENIFGPGIDLSKPYDNSTLNMSSPSDFDNPTLFTSPDSVIISPSTSAGSPFVHSGYQSREKRQSRLPLKFRDSSSEEADISFLGQSPMKTGKRGRPRKYLKTGSGNDIEHSTGSEQSPSLQERDRPCDSKDEIVVLKNENEEINTNISSFISKQIGEPQKSLQRKTVIDQSCYEEPDKILSPKKRGRPRKSLPDITESQKKRGRPKKSEQIQIMFNTDSDVDPNQSHEEVVNVSFQKKRGRPKKLVSNTVVLEKEKGLQQILCEVRQQNISDISSPSQMKRGPPQKSEHTQAILNDESFVDSDQNRTNDLNIAFQKKRGRPKKCLSDITVLKSESDLEQIGNGERQQHISEMLSPTPKKRGRPRKSEQVQVNDEGDLDQSQTDDVTVSFKKKLGRPRKSDIKSENNGAEKTTINRDLDCKMSNAIKRLPRKCIDTVSQNISANCQQDYSHSDSEEIMSAKYSQPKKGSMTKKTPCKKRGRKPSPWKFQSETVPVDCKMCGKIFPNSKDINIHMMFAHQALWSPDCPEGSTDRKALIAILKVVKKLTCQKCGKSQRFIQAYIDHVEWCGREHVTYTCHICGHSGLMLKWKKIHMRDHLIKEKTAAENANKNEDIDVLKKQRNAAKKAIIHLKEVQKHLQDNNHRKKKRLSKDDSDVEAEMSEDDEDDDEDFDENEEIQINRSVGFGRDPAVFRSRSQTSPRESEGSLSPISDISHRFWEEKYESPFVSSLLRVESDVEALSRLPLIVKTEDLDTKEGLSDLVYVESSVMHTYSQTDVIPSRSQEILISNQLTSQQHRPTGQPKCTRMSYFGSNQMSSELSCDSHPNISRVPPIPMSVAHTIPVSNGSHIPISTTTTAQISTIPSTPFSKHHHIPISMVQPASVPNVRHTQISSVHPVPTSLYNNNSSIVYNDCLSENIQFSSQNNNPSTSVTSSPRKRKVSRSDLLEMQCKVLASEYKNTKLQKRKLELQINLLSKKSEVLGINVLDDSSDSD